MGSEVFSASGETTSPRRRCPPRSSSRGAFPDVRQEKEEHWAMHPGGRAAPEHRGDRTSEPDDPAPGIRPGVHSREHDARLMERVSLLSNGEPPRLRRQTRRPPAAASTLSDSPGPDPGSRWELRPAQICRVPAPMPERVERRLAGAPSERRRPAIEVGPLRPPGSTASRGGFQKASAPQSPYRWEVLESVVIPLRADARTLNVSVGPVLEWCT